MARSATGKKKYIGGRRNMWEESRNHISMYTVYANVGLNKDLHLLLRSRC